MIVDALVQLAQLLLMLALAPLLTGYVRKLKAHLLRRQGRRAQPYRDLLKIIRKEVVLAHNACGFSRGALNRLRHHLTAAPPAILPTFGHRSRVQPRGLPDRGRALPAARASPRAADSTSAPVSAASARAGR